MLALEDAEEEDDDVDDRVAHVDIGQVQKLAVHWLASLVSELNVYRKDNLSWKYFYLNIMLSKFKLP